MRFARSSSALLVLACLAAPAAGQAPTLTVNGVTAADNSAVPHLTKLAPMTIEMTGTPGAPFALLLSADAFDGSVVGEENKLTGFFLKSWTPPNVFSPIHPVFDGIGTTFIASKLSGYTAADFVPDMPSPIFRFDAQGKFTLKGMVPPLAALLDTNPAGGNAPIVFDLESGGGLTIALYLQIVEFHVPSSNIVVGNGMKVVFDEVGFEAAFAYSEGTAGAVNALPGRQTLGELVDADLGDGNPGTFTPAPDFAAGGFPANLDVWMIALAGFAEMYPTSVPSQGEQIQVNPDVVYSQLLHTYASGIDFLDPDEPTRVNDNIEFPRLVLPGNRELFHWRNNSTVPPSYGFGVLFKDTNTFRNLVPAAAGTFTDASRSPWEIEVGVTPDGNRALVVLEQPPAGDRLFMLDLEPGGTFSNGQPIIEMGKPTGADAAQYVEILDESFVFASNGAGGYVAYFGSLASPTSTNYYPTRLWRLPMTGTGAATPTKVLPTASGEFASIARLDRQPAVSPDRDIVAIVIAEDATSAGNDEDVVTIRNHTGTPQIINITKFTDFADVKLGEWRDVSSGNIPVGFTPSNFGAGAVAFSPDGSLIAFAEEKTQGSVRLFYPRIATTSGSLAGNLADIVVDIAAGGKFQQNSLFPDSQHYAISSDNLHLLFFQGDEVPNLQPDRFDLFRYNRLSGELVNLTRTIGSKSYTGPWQLQGFTDWPTIEVGGTFYSPDRRWWYFLRDLRPSVGPVLANLVAVEIGGENPTFRLVNVMGNEFLPQFGGPPQPFTAPNIRGAAAFSSQSSASYHQIRRIGGDGPFRNYGLMVGQLSAPVVPQHAGVDQLWMWDMNSPGPAFVLTDIRTSGSAITAPTNSRIFSPTPSQTEPKIAFVLHNGTTAKQDVVLIDLGDFAQPYRLKPTGGADFAGNVTAGSLRFLPVQPGGLAFLHGVTPRPSGGQVDGVNLTAADPHNPVDVRGWFWRSDDQTFSPFTSAVANRAAFLWNLDG